MKTQDAPNLLDNAKLKIGRLEKENAELFRKWSASKSVRERDLEEKLKNACKYRNEGCEKLEEEVSRLRDALENECRCDTRESDDGDYRCLACRALNKEV